jgi:hypothetical protein
MTRSEMIECMAKRIWQRNANGCIPHWKALAEALDAELEAAGAVVVPREPTQEMIEAGKAAPCDPVISGSVVFSTASEAMAIYTAMIAASPMRDERGV